jgi:hypothetical protein
VRVVPTIVPTPVAPPRWDDEEGFAGGAEALVFGVLVFVIGTLLVVNAWAVIDAKFAASAAAREAVRAAVKSELGSELSGVAHGAAAEALAAHGITSDRPWTLEALGAQALHRCEEVAFEVRLHVPALVLPGIDRRRTGFDVSATHRELVDPYRSGLSWRADDPQEQRCAF